MRRLARLPAGRPRLPPAGLGGPLCGDGRLEECDPNGEVGVFGARTRRATLPPNNRLVIYELPTAWTLSAAFSQPERGVATFADVAALADERHRGANFAELEVLPGRAYLEELGVNALELLPPADSRFNREWGYGTSHYLAPDYELGFPEGNLSPTPNRDLAPLVEALPPQGDPLLRRRGDGVRARGALQPHRRHDFHIDDPRATPTTPTR